MLFALVQKIEDGRCSYKCVKSITRFLHSICHFEIEDLICPECFSPGALRFSSLASFAAIAGAE